MAKKRRIKTVILSDSDSDSAIVKRASVFPTPAMQALMSSYSEPAGASQEKAEGDAKIEPIEPAKSKGKPKGKWSRMLKELGDHNDRPETQSDVGSPEILLEGLHRTRATRQNLRNAVNNQAPEARKSMNMKALMEEALKAGPIQIGPGKKKGFKHEPVEEDIDDASSDIEEEEVKPSPRRKRRVLQREDTEEEMGEADDAVSVEASEQQMRKDHYDVSIGLEMVEDLHAFVSKAKSPKSGTKLEKQRVLELRQSREEGSDDDDDDGFLPIATPDLKAQPTKAPRRSLRTVPPVRTVAFGTNRSQPKVMTSQMAWDDKKDLIAWMLQNVDYNPYHAQISRYDLGDLDVKNWFNQEYPGFNWNNSDATVAHFSPATSIFEDFELFLHIVEFFSGQHIGVVKITIPEGFIDACDPVNYETNLKIMVRAHATTRAIQAGFERRAGPIYAVVPENPHDVAAHIFTDAIEAEYRNHAKVWTRSGTASDKDIWKQCQLADLRSEEMMLAPSGRLSWKDKYFAENICATDNLRKALGCGDPGLIEFNGNRLQRSSSTKCGVNIPSFDLSDTAGTAWGIQMTEIGAYKLVYHHSGAPRVWTVVEPSEFRRLEDLVAQILALPDCSRSANDGLLKYEPRCHQSVGHKRLSRSNEGVGASTVEDPGKTLYLSAETLEAESIRFNKFVQYQGEMVILFPFSYYQGYNVGPNVVESMAYASIRWEVFPMADLIRQCNRSCYRGKQPMLVDLTFAKPISKAVGGAIPSIEEALEYYRARFIS